MDLLVGGVDFFADFIEKIPIIGPTAKTCMGGLSKFVKYNVSRRQKNQKTVFVQLFQESSASIDERNLLIDEIIL